MSLPISYGFIGIGAMGFFMATNLYQKIPSSSPMYVFDINPDLLAKFKSRAPPNVHICSSSMEVTQKAAFIITMLPEGRHVKAVYSGKRRNY